MQTIKHEIIESSKKVVDLGIIENGGVYELSITMQEGEFISIHHYNGTRFTELGNAIGLYNDVRSWIIRTLCAVSVDGGL
jgi:hypothetical protein